MSGTRRLNLAAPPPDPFGERRHFRERLRRQLLGGKFEFETDSQRLLHIVRAAYAHLPAHRFAGRAPRFRVTLAVTRVPRTPPGARASRQPPPVRSLAGDGILCGAIERAGFVALSPRQRSALIVVASDLLRYPYHLRYELLEFAVYVLAGRVQRLVPLHAACLGRGDQGLLLMGPSGSGKSTLVLHALLDGLDFLAEDSVLVKPAALRATGVANFVHVRRDSLRFLSAAQRAALLQRATPIRRRSGVEKLEIDLRGSGYRLAAAPLRIRGVVFLSRRHAGKHPLLTRLSKATMLARLAAQQRYAAQQPGWSVFRSELARLPAYELRRGSHPRAAIEALGVLLPGS